VHVFVSDPENAAAGEQSAWVIDRSPAGLGLSIPRQDINVGRLLRVRSADPANTAQAVDVVVRNRTDKEETMELGCEFVRSYSYTTLLQFG
jgi:hypothetical protein